MATFKIGINMAGAISAGAYTAGVLDFLIEALDAWYAAKSRGEAVPRHDVSIEVFSGASAGGMCAAISTVLLQENFEHINDTSKTGTTNRFYESWVNKIDIKELLKADDLKGATQVISLLDSTVIEEIATYALTPISPLPPPRPYVSPNLTLFLSLTNLRGVPYSLNGESPGSVEETTFFYGDHIRFETLRPDSKAPPARSTHTVNLAVPGAEGGWDVLQTAAMATGAFPVFLAPRVLSRNTSDYTPPMWESVTSSAEGTPPPIAPSFPIGIKSPFVTLNVDGGVTNNDPFNYAHDYLTCLDPIPPEGHNFHNALSADRAVLSISPFPTTEGFDVEFDPISVANIFTALPRLFSALISQSRFFGESLNQIMNGTTFSRFVIAPSDDQLTAKADGTVESTALQCATLGAFGGFFERGFRAHDYALGRRNCQKFLSDHFVLPIDNPIIGPALQGLDQATRDKVLQDFARFAPGGYAQSAAPSSQSGNTAAATKGWMPIIPLCSTSVTEPLPPVPRSQISGEKLKQIVSLILKRFRAVVSVALRQIPFRPLRWFLGSGQPIITMLARRPLTDALIKQLGDSYKP